MTKTKDELIAEKVKELEALMADDTLYESKPGYIIEESEWNKCPIDVLETIVDINVAKLIMRRVDEMYGVKHSNEYQRPLYEEYSKLLRDLNE
jgi:hypothetical protein